MSSWAHATLWTIDRVLTGSGGFGASLFHAATDSSPMSGSNQGSITGSGNLGTYDDVSGVFSGLFSLSGVGGSSVSLVGDLDFVSGLLVGLGSLTTTFAGTDLTGAASNQLDFTAGWQCCGNNGNDPNTLHVDTVNGGMIMTLWGANGYDPFFNGSPLVGGFDQNNSTYPTNLGIDLRVHLTVPEPGSLILMGIGLLGLSFRRLLPDGKPVT